MEGVDESTKYGFVGAEVIRFHLFMRVYLPDMDQVNSTWLVPQIVKQ